MFKKALLPLFIFFTGALTISVLVVAKPKPQPRPAAELPGNVRVEVVEALQESMRLKVKAQGTVTPARQIDLVSQVSGQIVRVSPEFADGGFFKQGHLLVQIDDRDYRVALLSASAQLAEAERRLAEEQGLSRQAKREWRDLGNQSANDLFVRKPQLAAAKANLEAAKGSLELAQLMVDRTQIKVPFNGRVKQTYADLGQFVVAGTPIATVYDSSMVEIRLPLTEKQARLVDLPFTVNPGKFPEVTISAVVAGESNTWQGALVRTDAFVDANSRMYFVVVEVADPFNEGASGHSVPLLPGLFVDAEIEGKLMDKVMELPRTALYQRDKIVALDDKNTITIISANVLKKTDNKVWLQANVSNKAYVAVEKQSLTAEGTIVDPMLKGVIVQKLEISSASTPKKTPSVQTESKED